MCYKFWAKVNYDDSKKEKQAPMIVEDESPAMESNVFVVEEIPVIIEDIPVVIEGKEIKEKIQKYHVSQNKDKDAEYFMKWRVRKEGSEKTIQFFDTQKQAIEYAQGIAERAGSTVVIHKLDGSIRKQDYTKK